MFSQKKYQEQLDYIYSFEPKKDFLFPGELGLKRTKVLLELLDNPQEKIKIIHIAGTSGKGSTCYILSSLLIGQGFKTGLSLSPHLFDTRERTQINNKLISKEVYSKYIEEIKPVVNLTIKKVKSIPTHFEILTALNYYVFYKENVDYAIIETGLGGTYDATNTVTNPSKLSIITRIGFDHTKILGKSLSKIAEQKAGIINFHSTFITLEQSKKIDSIFNKIVTTKISNKIELFKNNYKKVSENIFSFKFKGLVLPNINLGLDGDFQFENTSLSLLALEYLSGRDNFDINRNILTKCLSTIHFDGRFSLRIIENKTVIFDGAHNPQKMRCFIKSLRFKYPDKKFDFLVAIKHKKDYIQMIKMIIPIARSISLISIGIKFINLDFLPSSLDKNGLINYNINDSPKQTLMKILKRPNNTPVVVTGSLHLISKFPEYFK